MNGFLNIFTRLNLYYMKLKETACYGEFNYELKNFTVIVDDALN